MDKKQNFPQFLLDKGYKTYRFYQKTNWNKEAKAQVQRILDNADVSKIKFKEGNYNTDICSFYLPCNFNTIYLRSNFNTQVVGGIQILFIKDLDFENVIYFGLHELGKIPTLIYPRPMIRVNEYYINGNKIIRRNKGQGYDNIMNYCLNQENYEDVLKAMFDKSIEFEYNFQMDLEDLEKNRIDHNYFNKKQLTDYEMDNFI